MHVSSYARVTYPLVHLSKRILCGSSNRAYVASFASKEIVVKTENKNIASTIQWFQTNVF